MAKGHKIAEGREAEIYAWEDGAVLRLLRDPNGAQQVEWEIRAMRAAREAGVSVPEVHGATTVDGRPGLIMERVDGIDMLAVVAKAPWKVWWVGRESGRLHAELHEVVAPADLPSLKEMFRRRMTGSPLVPAEVREFALAKLDELPDGDRICHGDFHPGNVMRTSGEPVVIDWTSVSCGDPAADFARTNLMMRIGDVPPGSPMVIRVGAHGLRGLLIGSYAGAYKRKRPMDMELAHRWETPVAANRLADNILPERAKLLEILEERMHAG